MQIYRPSSSTHIGRERDPNSFSSILNQLRLNISYYIVYYYLHIMLVEWIVGVQ